MPGHHGKTRDCVICIQTLLVAMLILLHIVNVHSLWIYELLPNNQCGVDNQRRDFEAVVWPWISAIVNVYLPLLLSVTLSILLVVRSRSPPNSPTTATVLQHFDVDDVQLSRICVAVAVFYVLATFPVILLNLFEYFLSVACFLRCTYRYAQIMSVSDLSIERSKDYTSWSDYWPVTRPENKN